MYYYLFRNIFHWAYWKNICIVKIFNVHYIGFLKVNTNKKYLVQIIVKCDNFVSHIR